MYASERIESLECISPRHPGAGVVVAPTPGLREFLSNVPMFRALSAEGVADLASRLDRTTLQGGQRLFSEGDDPDALYIVKSGSLGAYRSSGDGRPQFLGVINVGEIVGEMGLIARRPRCALIRALRDSELLRLSEEDFRSLVARYPQAMLHALSVVVQRLAPASDEDAYASPRTFAVLPHDGRVDARKFAYSLKQSLCRYGSCALIDADAGRNRDSHWFTALEEQHRFVIYLGESGQDEWRELCGRHADCFVLPVDAATRPSPWPEDAKFGAARARLRPRHLVLIHDGAIREGAAGAWLAHVYGAQHHHVRHPGDVERVARLLIGRGTGLVLSGGGARGFAHIGVVRALRESGRPIDSVGGTSIGAIVGAGVAADWSIEEMRERYKRTFVDGKPLRDYTLPLVSMARGSRVSKLLAAEFGDRDIRDLPLSYYCVSANLTTGRAAVLREGPLWLWLRASCAIPGILPPVLHRREVFVDGAIVDNLPVCAMREQRVGEVLAVDIGVENVLQADIDEHALPSWWRVAWGSLRARHRRPGILKILLRSGMLNADVANSQRRAQANLLFSPPVQDVDLLDWSAYERAIEAGYRHAVGILEKQ